MYEGLPKTGAAALIGGAATGLSWLLAIGAALVLVGIVATRLTRGREGA